MLRARMYSFFLLAKPNVMYLSVLSSIAMYMYGIDIYEIILNYSKLKHAIYFIIGIVAGSGAAGVFNMCLEVERDRLMTRTAKRPIVNGDISLAEGWCFGCVLLLISICFLLKCSIISTLLLLFTILFYIFYTVILKPLTDLNIVIGGIAGAMPVLIGWYANHSNHALLPYLLFLLIITWTPAHFWALAIYKIEDYKAVKLPMRPITVGIEQTIKEIWIYSYITSIISNLCLICFNDIHFIYYIFLNIMNVYLLYYAYNLNVESNLRLFLSFFLITVKYLLLLLIVFIFLSLKFGNNVL